MRPEKISILKEVKESLEGSDYVMLLDFKGATVEKLADLRGRMRGNKTRVSVVKNSFLRKAAEGSGWSVDNIAVGATAMVFGKGDVTLVAKALSEFIKENNNAQKIKGGRFGKDSLSPAEIVQLASVPSKHVLLGQLVGTLAAPMTSLVRVMSGKVTSVLYVLKAIEEQKAGKQQ